MGSEVKAKWKGFTSRLRAAIGGTKVPQGHGSTYPVQFTTFGISLGSWSREEAMLYGLASATAKARQREGLAFGLHFRTLRAARMLHESSPCDGQVLSLSPTYFLLPLQLW